MTDGAPREEREPEDYEPPDRPEASFEDATTAAGQREGESVAERLARERSGPGKRPARNRGRLSEEDRPDDEPEMLGTLNDDEDELPAEEAAVQIRKDAPGGTSDASDGYVEGERP